MTTDTSRQAVDCNVGSTRWHCSDEDGSGPDVGIDLNMGDGNLLYAGEVPGLKGGWSLVIYSKSGRSDIADPADPECAREMIERLSSAFKGLLTRAEKAESQRDKAIAMLEETQDKRNAEIDKLISDRAERDALQAEVARLLGALSECRAEIDSYICKKYPENHPVQNAYRKRDFAANPARIALEARP